MEVASNTFAIFKSIMVYVVFILASPMIVFFISKIILFQGIIGASTKTSDVWSAIFAVIVLHVAVGMYIYKAYFEADKAKDKPVKVD